MNIPASLSFSVLKVKEYLELANISRLWLERNQILILNFDEKSVYVSAMRVF